ncbi:MAG: ABC transporter ATP-binding protein [Chloroflexi bacterium]|nr:ABC transporter ATP-binding protein [Chloroflexota bacterium]
MSSQESAVRSQEKAQSSRSGAVPLPLIELKDVKTHFFLREGTVKALDGVSFTINRGEALGVVGESGCGKSVTAQAILRIVPDPGKIVGGEITLHRYGADAQAGNGTRSGHTNGAASGPSHGAASGAMHGHAAANPQSSTVKLTDLDPRGPAIRAIRGAEIAMVFQEPMTSFSPVHTIGYQIMEAIILHQQANKQQARERAIEILARVGMPRPHQAVDAYTHQLSGGQRQRAMIAMALSCNPSLLIADEPTTALDVTTQAQILDLLRHLQDELGMAIMFITHDLGVIAEMTKRVVVMYLGRVVEQADVDTLFHDPKHPYTRALINSVPRLGMMQGLLQPIEGSVPDPYNIPRGCAFHPRCPSFIPGRCDTTEPRWTPLSEHHQVRCHLYE